MIERHTIRHEISDKMLEDWFASNIPNSKIVWRIPHYPQAFFTVTTPDTLDLAELYFANEDDALLFKMRF
ncbi:hypothetical protein [Sphingomonas faeni]|uniref:hypothetical protein n=1 Tax=Sphingomonas faeni TaxID=185950 RepID=UPI000D3B56AB|nr:hypothetical protein [Sphingomonas faeni]